MQSKIDELEFLFKQQQQSAGQIKEKFEKQRSKQLEANKKLAHFENVENQFELARQKIRNLEEKLEGERSSNEKLQSAVSQLEF